MFSFLKFVTMCFYFILCISWYIDCTDRDPVVENSYFGDSVQQQSISVQKENSFSIKSFVKHNFI